MQMVQYRHPSKIGAELEGLSNPFGGTYTTELKNNNNTLVLK